MRRLVLLCFSVLLMSSAAAYGTIFGQLRGVVHDPQHRPIKGAEIELHAAGSDWVRKTLSGEDGSFSLTAVPLGDYRVTVTQAGFATDTEAITLASGTSPVLHFALQLGVVSQTVSVNTFADTANVDTVTPTTLVGREEIARTPGADRTNSLAMITNYVPGAYVTHDMLHMRGGHQASWLIDGIQIPNTNIASNVGAQIDPKDIDYIEVQRGSYNADVGDRTYGAFNVVPRTGFERNREGEWVLSAGSFLQTNDQLNFGSHTEKFAYYASVNGNRSGYGLQTPTGRVHHDANNGYGGFASLLYNRTAEDQFRSVMQVREDYFQIPYDPESGGDAHFDSSGLRDGQHERDVLVTFSWLHTFNASTVLEVSPFYHYNAADYEPKPDDFPVATTSKRGSSYEGAQASITGQIARNTLQGGLYGFGQQDRYKFGAAFRDASAQDFVLDASAAGGVMEAYLSDNFKALPWLTLIAGVRQTHFSGQIAEDATSPRFGAAVQLPRVNWVFRGFYGRFYQPPPLQTTSGPLARFASSQDTEIVPLHGERDEEHQFGVQIPFRGWLLDADNFRTRVNNFLDHANIGESSLYLPVTVDGALIRGWELSVRSPRLWGSSHAHLAYSNQIAEQRGAITGGLICSSHCDVSTGYTPVDHDQRNTLNVGFEASLPWHGFGAANVYYGSGFSNGSPDVGYPEDYLPGHTTVDLSVGKTFGARTSVSVSAVNVTNRRVLLDNSVTFGGFHYNGPREIFGEVRHRFNF